MGKIMEQAQAIRAAMDAAAAALTDEQAMSCAAMFPAWDGKPCKTGRRVRVDGILYKCLKTQTKAAKPDATKASWQKINKTEGV